MYHNLFNQSLRMGNSLPLPPNCKNAPINVLVQSILANLCEASTEEVLSSGHIQFNVTDDVQAVTSS